jgi:hypothetical protein
VSAPAPALAKPEGSSIVTVRLADVAVTVGYLSLAYGLLLVFLPVSFPRIILHSWQNGRLTMAMMAVTLVLDACLYFRIAYMLSAKPTILAAVCLGSLPVIIVVGLSFLLQGAVALTISVDPPNMQARVGEEILAHTYLGLVAAVFLPFLVIRLLQQFKGISSDRRS